MKKRLLCRAIVFADLMRRKAVEFLNGGNVKKLWSLIVINGHLLLEIVIVGDLNIKLRRINNRT